MLWWWWWTRLSRRIETFQTFNLKRARKKRKKKNLSCFMIIYIPIQVVFLFLSTRGVKLKYNLIKSLSLSLEPLIFTRGKQGRPGQANPQVFFSLAQTRLVDVIIDFVIMHREREQDPCQVNLSVSKFKLYLQRFKMSGNHGRSLHSREKERRYV